MGGDFFAKQKGPLGECIALIQHFAKDPRAVDHLRGRWCAWSRKSCATASLVRSDVLELAHETRKEISGPTQ